MMRKMRRRRRRERAGMESMKSETSEIATTTRSNVFHPSSQNLRASTPARRQVSCATRVQARRAERRRKGGRLPKPVAEEVEADVDSEERRVDAVQHEQHLVVLRPFLREHLASVKLSGKGCQDDDADERLVDWTVIVISHALADVPPLVLFRFCPLRCLEPRPIFLGQALRHKYQHRARSHGFTVRTYLLRQTCSFVTQSLRSSSV
eukprot:3848195-Rhodomonas_salina.2